MILNVKVDVNKVLNELFEDYNSEDDSYDINIKEEIKNDIVHQVRAMVVKEIKQPLKDDMSNRVKILIRDSFGKEIDDSVRDFVKNKKIQNRYSSDEDITVNEWIKNQFSENIRNNVLIEIVENSAKEISQELRDRYDLLFASNLITKLNQQGLLKEGVFKTLMETTTEKN